MDEISWIRDGLQRPGKSQRGLAKALGLDPAAISRLLSGKRQLKAAEIAAVRAYLGQQAGGGSGLPQVESDLRTSPVNDSGAIDLVRDVMPLDGTPLSPQKKDLPVRGYGEGGEGDTFFITNGDAVDFTYRPGILSGVKDAYAVEIRGDSMEPAAEHGHLAWVHPHRLLKPRDLVVVQFNDGRAIVKRLKKRTDTQVIVEQFNPPREIKISRKDIKQVHLVVGIMRVMA